MNPWQMAQQIRHALRAVVWPDGSANPVFGQSVYCYGGAANEDAVPAGFPFALVEITGGEVDEDHPDLIEQQFEISAVVDVAGDPIGEMAVIGGPRADAGKSAGAGIAEVAARVRAAVGNLTGYDGAGILVSATSTGSALPFGRGRHLAMDKLTIKALCTSQPYYAAPQQFALSAGTLTWAGSHCSSRFDFLRYRVGYKTGAAAPSTPADCDVIIYTGTAATVGSITLEPGTTYAVFADYDPRGTGSVANSSDGAAVGAFIAQ